MYDIEQLLRESKKIGLPALLREIERELILAAMSREENYRKVAESLGIARTSLVEKRKRLNLPVQSPSVARDFRGVVVDSLE